MLWKYQVTEILMYKLTWPLYMEVDKYEVFYFFN